MSVIQQMRQRALLKTATMASVGRSLFSNGLKTTIRIYGWRVFAVVFIAYLIRDISLYIILPWWFASALVGR